MLGEACDFVCSVVQRVGPTRCSPTQLPALLGDGLELREHFGLDGDGAVAWHPLTLSREDPAILNTDRAVSR